MQGQNHFLLFRKTAMQMKKQGGWSLQAVNGFKTSVNPHSKGEGTMKALIGATFLVLVWTAFSFGGEPVPPVVPDNQVIISEQLDEVNDLLEENELAGKKPKPYCELDVHTWEIVIKNGGIAGTFYPAWEGAGAYPVTGTKEGKTLHLIATGLCADTIADTYELNVTKEHKGKVWAGTSLMCYCDKEEPCYSAWTSLRKGRCD
jgi:hypothetical protein